jgi:hypothetical protein
MRAAQRVRIGNRGGPPAFAPVILWGSLILGVLVPPRMLSAPRTQSPFVANRRGRA